MEPAGLTQYEEQQLRIAMSLESQNPSSTAFINMNAISCKEIFGRKYGGRVYVPPNAITIMWYFDDIGDFMGAFTPEGVEKNKNAAVPRKEKEIEAIEEKAVELDTRINDAEKALDQSRAESCKILEEKLKKQNEKIAKNAERNKVNIITLTRDYDSLVEEVKRLEKENNTSEGRSEMWKGILGDFIQERNKADAELQNLEVQLGELSEKTDRFDTAYESDLNRTVRVYIANNPIKIAAITANLKDFMSSADKTQPFYCFIPIFLRRIRSSNVNILPDHANGLLLVKRPEDADMQVILIEPVGSDTSDKRRVNEIRLRKSIINLCEQILDGSAVSKWLQIRAEPPQYHTNDLNCIFWTTYIADELIDKINNSKGVPLQSFVSETITRMTVGKTDSATEEKKKNLSLLIQKYKIDNIISTIPLVLNVFFPPTPQNPRPLHRRIQELAAKHVDSLLYVSSELLYRVAERFNVIPDEYKKAGGYTFKKKRRTCKQTRTYKQ